MTGVAVGNIGATGMVRETWLRNLRSTLMLVVTLILPLMAILHGIQNGEFSYNVDETQHAVTGLYVADLLRDHPLANPVQYTHHYYAQYPALSGVIHWPPFFYLWEGLSFLTLGPTVSAARLTIAFFAVVGLYFYYRLVREVQEEWTAALATVFLALAPSVLLFEKTVMLEIPSLSLCLGALFFWRRYLFGERKNDIYWAAVFASLAMLTKQNSIFLVPFFLLSGLWIHGWPLLRRSEVVRASMVALVITSPFYILVYLVHWKTIAMDLEDTSVSGLQRLIFYWQALPHQLGWVLLLLSMIGVVTNRRWDRSRSGGIMLMWIAACYLTFTFIGLKESRYILYWLPAFVYFAAGLLTRFFRKPPLRLMAGAAAIVVLAMSLGSAWAFHRPFVSGYDSVAKTIIQLDRPGVVLFDGPLAGNFIFFMRANDPQRRYVVLRKALYVYRIKESGGSVELIHNREQLEGLIRNNGVRFVVLSDRRNLRFVSQQLLRDLVTTPEFRQVGSFPVSGNDLPNGNTGLLVFENLNWAPPLDKFLRIRMLTLGQDIVVPFGDFKFAQSQAGTTPSQGK